MSLNVTQVNQIIPAISRDMAVKAIADSQTAKLLIANGSVQAGVKGKASVLQLSQDVHLQDGSACGARNPLGTTSLGNTTITVAQLKDEANFCAKALYSTYYSYAIGKGQDPRSEGQLLADFLRSILEVKSAEINLANEQLLWNGDTTISGTSNLKYINGILKQLATAGTAVSLPATGSTIVEKLQNAHLAMPVEIRSKSDYRIFIGQDMYDAYTVALSLKNIYKPTEDYKLFGTTATLVPVTGLNGSNKVVATRLSNLLLGMDGDNESDNVLWNFSLETNSYYCDFHYALGIVVIFPDQVGLGDFS